MLNCIVPYGDLEEGGLILWELQKQKWMELKEGYIGYGMRLHGSVHHVDNCKLFIVSE